jgi:hypothetical protein
VWDSNSVLASNGLNAQDLADSVAVGRVAELTEHSIQNSKDPLNLARFWWDEGLAERVGFGLCRVLWILQVADSTLLTLPWRLAMPWRLARYCRSDEVNELTSTRIGILRSL